MTGFDAKKVNTLYVDKNLRYHGLIQAYSRTNRILNDVKSQGNIVSFRNLKRNTDEAIALFSDKNASEEILIEPYETYVVEFNRWVKELLQTAPAPRAVDHLRDEIEKLAFIKSFRNLMRILNILTSFSQFSWNDLFMDQQSFEDFKSKYLDLYDQTRARPEAEEKASILDEVDFELELIRRDEVNVAYILALLTSLKETEKSGDANERGQQRKVVMDLLGSEPQLRSKRELIEKFIEGYLPDIRSATDVEVGFDKFWSDERDRAMKEICETEGLRPEAVSELVSEYHFTQREPLRERIVSALKERPKILQRKTIVERVTRKLLELIRTFDDR